MNAPRKPGPTGLSIPPPVMSTEPERRRDLRVPLRILRVETELNGECFFGYAKNISSTGLYIESSNPRAIGTRVRVKFTLPPSKEMLSCEAEVVWSREYVGPKGLPPGMGMRFLDLPHDQLDQVKVFIEKG